MREKHEYLKDNPLRKNSNQALQTSKFELRYFWKLLKQKKKKEMSFWSPNQVIYVVNVILNDDHQMLKY